MPQKLGGGGLVFGAHNLFFLLPPRDLSKAREAVFGMALCLWCLVFGVWCLVFGVGSTSHTACG
jgi:hypothetical protein